MKLKELKNLITLSQKVRIYVPSTTEVNKEINNEEFVKLSLQTLSKLFGGSTSYQAFGAWIAKNGDLVTEKITICESFCNEKQLNENIDLIYNFCLNLKKDLKQEAIALEINNEMHFV